MLCESQAHSTPQSNYRAGYSRSPALLHLFPSKTNCRHLVECAAHDEHPAEEIVAEGETEDRNNPVKRSYELFGTSVS
jgi:hypothetical protein